MVFILCIIAQIVHKMHGLLYGSVRVYVVQQLCTAAKARVEHRTTLRGNKTYDGINTKLW